MDTLNKTHWGRAHCMRDAVYLAGHGRQDSGTTVEGTDLPRAALTRRFSTIRVLLVMLVSFAWRGLAQSPPTITAQPASQAILLGSNGTFCVTVNGTGPFTYQWQFNGTNLPNNLITTVAGNGGDVYSGDGYAATNVAMQPFRLAFDAFGNLYIADSRTPDIGA